MIYFINFGLPEHKSGIEHAEIKRLKLFNKYRTPAKIIARDWSNTLHKDANKAGVSDEHLLGMFDYFQNAINVPQKTLTAFDLDFGLSNITFNQEVAKNRYIVTNSKNNNLVARVNYDKTTKQVTSVELFDEYDNLYCVDFYDSRGFKSLRQWYTPDNKIGNEEWLTPSGKTVIRTFNKFNMQHKLVKTGWQIQEKNGAIHTFSTIDELFEYFLNLINARGKNIFILDRSLLADEALLNLKRPAYTVFHLHNSQAGNAQEPLHSVLNNNYEFALTNLNKYDAVVSATNRQTQDVIKRFKPQCKTFTIPVGIVDDETLHEQHIPAVNRTYGKIIAVARIAYEKHLTDLVRAIKIVHDQIPEVTLDLYGYADSSHNYREKRKIEKLITELNLQNVVTFKGYTNDLASIEKHAQIFGLTSRMEGFNLAIMEAMAHGVIGVTYNVNYGPNDIVVDQQNGYIVDYGSWQALAKRMITILQNKDLMQTLSTNAYKLSERYSQQNVWQAWQKLLNDAKNKLDKELD